MNIAPFRGLRYNLALLSRRGLPDPAAAVTAPPYDVISPSEHRSFLAGSEFNITALTLGDAPGEVADYDACREKLDEWLRSGVLVEEPNPGFYVYRIDYVPPVGGETAGPRRFLGLVALGKLHPFSDRVVLPHERTFPKIVDDRLRLLDATRTHLESIALLYADPEHVIDRILEAAGEGEACIEVEAKPGERHALYRIDAADTVSELAELFKVQRPIIADGHHRYTMGQRFREERGAEVAGSEWQLMTFANLYGEGLAILATHRLVKLRAMDAEEAFQLLLDRLDEVGEGDSPDMRIETATRAADVRFTDALREEREGVEKTGYALLENVVLGEWLGEHVPEDGVSYYKEGTGERAALERGDGDLLFRMQPVDRAEFQRVVEGGEVFPHKTTFFYPKLWSGLALWRLTAV